MKQAIFLNILILSFRGAIKLIFLRNFAFFFVKSTHYNIRLKD